MPTELTLDEAIPRCVSRLHHALGLPTNCGRKLNYKSKSNLWHCPGCGHVHTAKTILASQDTDNTMTFA